MRQRACSGLWRPQVEQLEDRLLPSLLGNQLFPSDNPWNQRISDAPVAANSSTLVTSIGATRHLHPDFGTIWDGAYIGIPFNVVSGSQPRIDVVIDAYADESDLVSVPIPWGAVIEGDPRPSAQNQGDRHLLVYDRDNNVAWELFNVHRPWETPDGHWHADSLAYWDLKQNWFRTPGDTSADAAGLPILPGLVRPDEVLDQGRIDHALRFTVPKTRNQYVYPASHHAGSNDATLPRMGERFRLRQSFDISGFSPANQVILQALKDYGMIVADNGGAWYISGQPSERWNDDQLGQLKSLQGSDFEAIDLRPIVVAGTIPDGTVAAGSVITVTGQGFSGSAGFAQVYIGSAAAAAVTVVSDTKILATAPANLGTSFQVSVRTPYGTSNQVPVTPGTNPGPGPGGNEDNFDRPDSSSLGSRWSVQSGAFGVSGGKAAATGSGYSQTAFNASSVANLALQADLSFPASAGVRSLGLVARQSSSVSTSFYWGGLVKAGGDVRAEIWRSLNGDWAQLASADVPDGLTNRAVRFETVGWSLKLFVDGGLAAYAFDASLLEPGRFGIRGAQGGSFDNFRLDGISRLTADLPFSDDFAAAAGSQLGRAWTEQASNFTITGSGEVAITAGYSQAVLNTAAPADVSLEARVRFVDAAGIRSLGVIARAAAEGSLYWGGLVSSGGDLQAEIWRSLNGAWDRLASQDVPDAPTGRLLRFDLSQDSLKLFVDGSVAASAADKALPAPGMIGIRGAQGGVFDTFTANRVSGQTTALPYSDDFAAPAGSSLASVWSQYSGKFTANGAGTVMGAEGITNHAVLNAAAVADVVLHAQVSFGAADGIRSLGLVARHTGPGDSNLYWAGLVSGNGDVRAEIWRNLNGIWTLLASRDVADSQGARSLRFEAVGASLKLFVDSLLVASASDSALGAPGLVGMRGYRNGRFESFQASAL
jgi:hypothetical protein